MYTIPTLPLKAELETKEILLQLNRANKQLAELKGVSHTIPNENILISTLSLQEAKDSSEVENIVTTHDELYKADLDIKSLIKSASAKEVLNYRKALQSGFNLIRKNKLLTNNALKTIQQDLENNKAGFRAVPGTNLQDSRGNVVYTPPQTNAEIETYMTNLEQFINNQTLSNLDPLIKVAIIHHQFESIHSFYDGNGRTGRILMILYLVAQDLLDLPILYLSRYITKNKSQYYALLQAVRDSQGAEKDWQNWVLFVLQGIEQTAKDSILLVKGISQLMAEYKQILRPVFGKQYKHELLNNLFFHPYTKIEFIQRDVQVQRKAATKYLDIIVENGLLEKVKLWRTNYYLNTKLVDLFINFRETILDSVESIESVHKTAE